MQFWVSGLPQPGGSKRAFVISGTNRASVSDANPKALVWKNAVGFMANQYFKTPLDGPLQVTFEFYMPRPTNHFGKKGLKLSAPLYHSKRPDALKLSRSTEDALTGIAWRDDSQIAVEHLIKRYTEGEIGARITIEPLIDLWDDL